MFYLNLQNPIKFLLNHLGCACTFVENLSIMTKEKPNKEQVIEEVLEYASIQYSRKDLESMGFDNLKAIHDSCIVPLMKKIKQ